MQIEYDRQANAVYIEVNEGEHARTVEVEPQRVYVDVDTEGRTLGVEFLGWDIFQQYLDELGGM